ncbi:MAG TPA: carboxypeptidase-like regulatory domain-containing protein, partial [Pirellulales bacterium]
QKAPCPHCAPALLAVATLVCTLGISAHAAPADSPAEDNPPIMGIVVDRDDNPAPGVTVWLLGGPWDAETRTQRAETTTDRHGRFAFDQFSAEDLFEPARGAALPSVMARDERRRLGWAADLRAPNAKNLRLRLHEVATFHGKLLDTSGQPIAGATVQPRLLHELRLRDQGYDGMSLTAEIAAAWREVTAADGGFSISNVPVDGGIFALITAPRYGQPKVRWDLGNDLTLRLAAAGAISGSIELPQGVERPAGLTVDLHRQEGPRRAEEVFRVYYYQTALPIDDQGRFEFHGVPPGDYVVSLNRNRREVVYGDPTPPITIAAGEQVADLRLPLERSIIVRGVTVDNRDQKPVKNVTLRFTLLDPDTQVGRYVFDETSDEDGRFTAYTRPGKLVIQPWQTPPGFLAALGDVWPEPINVEQDLDVSVKIERSVEVTGMIIDDQGRPAPHAEVQLILPRRGFRYEPSLNVRADAAGKFVLKEIDPADNLPLRARSAAAVTDGAVILSPEQLKQPVRLQLHEDKVCRLSGRVVNEMGLPLARIKVNLSANRAYESRRIGIHGLSTSGSVESLYTDESGVFVSGPLWPGDLYQALVMTDRFVRAESQQVRGKAGETSDMGTIALRRTNGFVVGLVLDSSRQPVAGVTVFNSGDALQPVSVTTDATGRFRLDELFGGAVYIFARKPGYRFSGVRTLAGSNDVELTLLKQDEPPPANQPPPAPLDASPQEELARWMLEQLWEFPQAENRGLLVRYMARLDAKQAEAWATQLGKPNEQEVLIGASERLVDLARQPNLPIDYDQALSLAAGLADQRGCEMLETLAELTVVRSPERSLQFVEAARLRSDKLEPSWGASLRAQLGGLLVKLGQAQDGRKLIDEAASTLERAWLNSFAAANVVTALAPYNLPRARRFPDAAVGDQGDRNRLLAVLAAALATRDLNEALATAAQITGDASADMARNRALMEIAFRLALARREEAVRVLDLMDGHDGDKTRVEALGWLAVVMARRDKKTAIKLIDQSLELLLDKPEAFRSWGNFGGRSVLAAWIARQAREIGYPDMDSVVMRVLAARPTMADEFDSRRRLEHNVGLALVLGFSDPQAARRVLEVCEPSGQLVGSGLSMIRRGDWIEAWSLADPAHAKALIERELATLATQEKLDLHSAEIVKAAGFLTLPSAQWPRHFAIGFGGIWFPNDEWAIKWGRFRP